MDYRMRTAKSLAEELFILQTMGDDRNVAEVYVAGMALMAKGQGRNAASARALERA
jgi:guanine deaminase